MKNTGKLFNWGVIDLDHVFRKHYNGLKKFLINEKSDQYSEEYDWANDQQFVNDLLKQIKNKIISLVKKLHCKNVIITNDNIHSTEWIWRTEHWSTWAEKFKSDFYSYRQDPIWAKVFNEDFNNFVKAKDYFYYTYLDFEADDIIAIVTKSIVTKYPNAKVYIFSKDSDFYQLISDKVMVLDTNGDENLHIYPTGEMNLWYKIINGQLSNKVPSLAFNKEELKEFLCIKDRSEPVEEKEDQNEDQNEEDNSMYRKLTREEICKVVNDLPRFREWIEKNPDVVENRQHLINMKVMDFNQIPKNLFNKVEKDFWNNFKARNNNETEQKQSSPAKQSKQEKQNKPKNPFELLGLSDEEDEENEY